MPRLTFGFIKLREGDLHDPAAADGVGVAVGGVPAVTPPQPTDL